jgi:hypothetical protein
METYTFAETSACRYRTVYGQKLQVSKVQENLKKKLTYLRHLSQNSAHLACHCCTDFIHEIHQ